MSLKNHGKCEACVESKTTKKFCKSIKREFELLNLIHNDLGDLKSTMTRGGKHFYITFIDDYSRYTKVYLLRNKDEVRDSFIKYKNEEENQLSIRKLKGLELIGEESMSPTPLTSIVKIMGSFMKLLLLIPLSPME